MAPNKPPPLPSCSGASTTQTPWDRVEYCRGRGVEIAPFVAAFGSVHRTERQKALSISATAGIRPNQVRDLLRPQLASFIAQDMKDVALGAQVPVEKACQLFNDKAAHR